jgi:hypothetical protein
MTEKPHAKILVVAALALCGLFAGCKGRGKPKSIAPAERPSLAEVTVRPIAPIHLHGKEIRLDDTVLAAKAKKILEDAEVFAVPEANRPSARVSLEVELVSAVESSDPEIGARVHLRVAIHPSTAPARFAEDVDAMGQAPLAQAEMDEAGDVFQRLAERTVADLLQAYVARQKLWDGGEQQIAAALASTENDLRVEAMRIVAARSLRGEIPAVLRLLSDDDENVRDAALGTLVALRERSAVKVLAKSRPMRDTREMRKILDAIAMLGGREAQDYLSFVAETHDDEEIRAMAKAALARLTQHSESNKTTK